MNARFPGVPAVIHGNGAVAHVMSHVCGGVIGYPITPSTEISEIYEAFRAAGGCNVWGKHPFFFEPEGEHSAQSGALGAALTGGKYVSNASSSQGILYGLESHYVTVGKKVGGFVLHVAARAVSRHSLNVMAGHDDVYALLPSGYTVLFASNPQEAADLAAIAYKVSAMSLIPVANAMDGFATSHMLCEALMPEPELLEEFLGDPAGRIAAPTVAQEMLFGAKGRVFELKAYLTRRHGDIAPHDLAALSAYLFAHADEIERDNEGRLVAATAGWIPEELRDQWRRQWLGAHEKGTRQRVPALVDVNNPGLTGGVQNQADYQAGVADHRTHFASDVPRFVDEAMTEYGRLTGRAYAPVKTFLCDDADDVLLGLGSVTDDAEAVATYLRTQGRKVGVVSIKLLQPFPDAAVVEALAGKRAVTVLERSDATTLTNFVTHALFKALENAGGVRHAGIPAIGQLPRITTAVFGLGAHDLQPRHLIAACKNMALDDSAPFVYLGSQFFEDEPAPRLAELQDRLRVAYPQTQLMALRTEPNPHLLPDAAFRIRFHSVGGYGTVATGKLLTDILAGVLAMHSKSAPKYGSEKSGAPTNFYITLSPEPVKITNAELEEVEIVVSPDHKVFSHTNPLAGLAAEGTFIMQSEHEPLEVWRALPAHARRTIRERGIHFYIVDAFAVAKKHAPTEDLQVRMMGVAFIGAVCGHVDRVVADATEETILAKIRQQISKKFGSKGRGVAESNMSVIREGLEATRKIDYDAPAFAAVEAEDVIDIDTVLAASMVRPACAAVDGGLFDPTYYDDVVASRFRDGSVSEAPILPGTGLFMPPGCAAGKDKGLFRLTAPEFIAERCTGCMECALVCPDAAVPNAVHEIHDLLGAAIGTLELTTQQADLMRAQVFPLAVAAREAYNRLPAKDAPPFARIVATAAEAIVTDDVMLRRNLSRLADALAVYPVAKTRPFFDTMERSAAGCGGLFAAAIDPSKCSGCLECIEVCGPGALVARKNDAAFVTELSERFAFMTSLPNTPVRFFDNATRPGGDTKRLLLDRQSYYSMTGGHGACRGCGEVTAIRFITSANHAIAEKRRKDHVAELTALIAPLEAKLAIVAHDRERSERIAKALAQLERRLYLFEGGPTGNGPAGAAIVNATGCSSVYASTFPANPYTDPWVNSLFQDSPALAKGVFEGLSAAAADDFRAMRIAKLELEDQYDPPAHDAFFTFFGWEQFSPEERALTPAVISMGGDGATYDIGFGALSRLLTTDTPVKIVVLNTGAYSNTGGQASTASFVSQDSDLSRVGAAHVGKEESRKELGLIAAFHPKVLVVQTATAIQGHFLPHVIDFLSYDDSPALMDIYTPCQPEHGIADDAANARARVAVESRMSPVFVHDPRRGSTLHERFSLEGNPDIDRAWTTTSLEYVDADGVTKLMDVPLTPADFALGEGRFKKHFHTLHPEVLGVPIHEYVELSAEERYGKTPFVWSTDSEKRLVRQAVAPSIVHLVEERRRNWATLQYLAGLHVGRLQTDHLLEIDAWKERYDTSSQARELSIDSIARAMSELAAASGAPSSLDGPNAPIVLPALAALSPVPVAPGPVASNGQAAANGQAGTNGHASPNGQASPNGRAGANGTATATKPLVSIAEEDLEKCTNCKTCYQNLSELFEKTKIVGPGGAKEVARVIPGVLERIAITPDLIRRAERIVADCDAEIIR
jgi:pyruvate-ferredoxin/flavodoxin oxidoreductase